MIVQGGILKLPAFISLFSSMKPFKPLGLVWIFSLFLSLIVNPLQYSKAAQNKAISPERYQELVDKIHHKDVLRLIVSLNPSSEPILQLPRKRIINDNNLLRQRRKAITDIQSRVSARIKPSVLKRFRNQPSLVLEADKALLEIIQNDPEVINIQLDQLLKINLSQSIPIIGANNTISAGYNGENVDIAILDTGVDIGHDFFTDRVIAQACFSTTNIIYNSSSLCPNGDDVQVGFGSGINCSGINGCDHGTHVAGIAAGQGINVSGVAPKANIISIQIFSRFDDPSFCGSANCIASFTSDMVMALEYLYDNHASFNLAAVNLSLGGEAYTSAASCDAANSVTKAAIDDLRSVGIATVASSGNESLTNAIGAPGCISSAISVGATSDNDSVASFSNSAPWLTLLAPGFNINSSIPRGGFTNYSGTSMAAPHVSGALAVLKQVQPSSSVDLLVTTLTDTGLAVTDDRNSIVKPRIQLDAAALALGANIYFEEIIIDNLDTDTSQTGSWKVSGGANPWNEQSLYSNSNSTFKWLPSLSVSQAYSVYAWWTFHQNRSDSVPYSIKHDGGLDTIEVNQHDINLASQWSLLGTYQFTAGASQYVELSSENGQASADAVRFVPIGGEDNIAPTLEILSPTNNGNFLVGEEIIFTGTASDYEDGELSQIIHWHSSIDGDIGDGASLTLLNLLLGVHTITASVIDSGASIVQQAVTITISAALSIDIIVDNLDDNASQTGSWLTSSGSNPWDGQSVYNKNGDKFSWQPKIPISGIYQVYAWWTYHKNRSTNVPYYINHNGITDTSIVNQNELSLGGQWNLLGNYFFQANMEQFIEVTSENGQASADAVRLVLEEEVDNFPPSISISSPSEEDIYISGETITLLASASDPEDGNLSNEIQWSSDLDGLLALGNDLNFASLSVGSHALSASVEDNEGERASDSVRISVLLEVPEEFIVDNQDNNTSFTGSWLPSSGENPWAGESLYNNQSSTFRWSIQLNQAGDYQVYTWWTYHNNRSSSVPYRISHSDGVATIIINQHNSNQAGKWILLGVYSFIGDGSEYVEISSENGQASADAIRLIKH